MPHPIRDRTIDQILRRGWSEYLAWRGGTYSHAGFDYYAPLGTWIYGTDEGGRVSGKAGPGGEAGWQVTITYPRYTTRNVHMLGPSPLNIGDPVGPNTVIGYVGATGNAANIVWNGLRHLHHEVYTAFGRVDPLAFHGPLSSPGLAGGGTTPITPEQEAEDDMTKPRIIQAFGLPDTAVIGGGLAYVFPNAGELTTIRNVERPTNPEIDQTQTVGDAGMTAETRRALLYRIVGMYASAQGVLNAIAGIPGLVDRALDDEQTELLSALARPVDLSPIVEAVRESLATQGVAADLAPVIAAVEAGAASVLASIATIPREFTVTAKP